MADQKLEVPDDIQKALKTIIDGFDNEERSVREWQIREWKKLELYWAGFTKVWWSETAHDWRFGAPDTEYYSDGQGDFDDKPVNVFRAFLETIIAALSATVPPVRCVPDDADNNDDISTAKAGDNIAELIYRHVDAPLLWVRSLYVYCTQGMIAAYNYTDTDEKYGTYETDKTEDFKEQEPYEVCSICGGPVELQQIEEQKFKFGPDNEDIVLDAAANEGNYFCPNCAQIVDPKTNQREVVVQRITGKNTEPKSRQCIEINGGLFIKVPNYARCQKDVPYLAYCYETHYSNIYKKFPHLRGKMEVDPKFTSSSGAGTYERWGRLSPQYRGEYPTNTPTVRNWWLRPSSFECISDEGTREELYKLFPDGCYCVFINEEYACASNESLDDHWTLTFNPLSEYIHYDPLGLFLVSIQDIVQELLSLTLQTIEHGIPQTFVNPKRLDFEAYRNSEVVPGGIYPTLPGGTGNIGDDFYTTSTATLSKEVGPFSQRVQELGQFVSGALPSLFGGSQPGSSRTAAQYSMSRNQALQRLQTTWKMINYWWKNVFSKVIPAYIDNLQDDEKFVKKQNGSYVNVWIRQAQLQGKIGSFECESADELPQTYGQVKDSIMQLFQMNNPEILQALGAPENLEILRQAIGLNDFHVPGADDRDKQYGEIQLLIQSIPIDLGDGSPFGDGVTQYPSIMPEKEVDNHMVQAEVCRNWLVSEPGRLCKVENEAGYRNVLLHLQQHLMMLAPPPMAPAQPKLKPVSKEKNDAA